MGVGDYVGLMPGAALGTLGQTGNAAGQPLSEAHGHFGIKHDGLWIDPFYFLNGPCPWM